MNNPYQKQIDYQEERKRSSKKTVTISEDNVTVNSFELGDVVTVVINGISFSNTFTSGKEIKDKLFY